MANVKYVVEMGITRRFQMREYVFATEDEVNDFLMDMNDYELDQIIDICKYTGRRCYHVYGEFLD